MSLDPESGEEIPDGLVAPFPDPGETALDHSGQAASRVAVQYARSTKMQAMVAAHADDAQRIEDCSINIPPLDDPAIAGNVNLDVTGDLVGQSRLIQSIEGASTPAVALEATDDEYRILIAMRILRNTSQGTGQQYLTALETVFTVSPPAPSVPIRYYELGGLVAGIEIGQKPTDLQVAILDTGPIPRAMGVGVGRVWFDPAGYFAFAEDTGTGAKGFGEIGDSSQGGSLAEIF